MTPKKENREKKEVKHQHNKQMGISGFLQKAKNKTLYKFNGKPRNSPKKNALNRKRDIGIGCSKF